MQAPRNKSPRKSDNGGKFNKEILKCIIYDLAKKIWDAKSMPQQ